MTLSSILRSGLVIPAHPLALTPNRTLDERRQRALTRYYMAAGAGGIAVGVHTTQFAIREPRHGLFRPVLDLAAETAAQELETSPRPFVKVAGICGETRQAVTEAEIARAAGYDVGLVSLAAMADADDAALVKHCRRVGEVIPLFGFYLQSAVGGRVLGFRFWRELAELPSVVAIKIAPFNRYQTVDVVRAITEAGRDDIALYTGNDDNIVPDLVTPFRFASAGGVVERRIVGGLLGQWAVWTKRAVEMLEAIKGVTASGTIDAAWLSRGAALTDANGAIFDASNAFAGCIPGIHEMLRRQGLLRGTWTLDPREQLSPGQSDEIDRVTRSYPWLTDDEFVRDRLEGWLKD